MKHLEVGTPVKIRMLSEQEIIELESNNLDVGWNPEMQQHLGKTGTIGYVHMKGSRVGSYDVDVEGLGSWCWPPSALEEIGDSIEKVEEEYFEKVAEKRHQVMSDFVAKAEAREPNRLAKSDDEALGRTPKSGGYDKVLYGRCVSFVRFSDYNEAGGEFFVFYKAERVNYKLRGSDAYGDKANAIIRTLLTEPRQEDGLGGVIVVLDNDGYVQLVREQL